MADRRPLIINPSANQIQELINSDNLLVGGSVSIGGSITATEFTGDGSGLTNIQGISNSLALSGGTVANPSLEIGTSNAGAFGYTSPVTGLTSCFALTFPQQTAGISPGIGGTWGLIGYNMGSTLGFESILIGSCARANPPASPRAANNNTNAEGLQVTNRGRVNISGFDSRPVTINRMGSTTNQNLVDFNNNGTQCGRITITGGTSVNYGTTSDYRLKENIVNLTGARVRLDNLNIKRFNFVTNPGTTVDGFLAHEVQTVIPEAVLGTKDQVATQEDVDNDEANAVGDAVYQSIDQSKIVPLLTAALQEAFVEIDALKTRIAALEG